MINRSALAVVVGAFALCGAACTPSGGSGSGTTTTPTTAAPVDNDADGYNTASDCNDNDATIHPGAADALGDDIDQNCDGVDGVATNNVYVSSAASDTSTCGDIAEPCRTINKGISQAVAFSRSQVLVSEGSFGAFSVTEGINVSGHYKSTTWKKAGAGDSVVTSTTASPSLVADGISAATVVSDLVVQGRNGSAGQATIAAAVTNSTDALVFDTVTFRGGVAGDGTNGNAGTNASQTAAASGSAGEAGANGGGSCDDSTRKAGGNGGGAPNAGGKGGDGGKIDTKCSVWAWEWNYDSTAGLNGAAGSGGASGGNAGGPLTTAAFCGSSTAGHGANGTNGAAGSAGPAGVAGASSNGTVNTTTWAWTPAASATGGAGGAGNAGGGGGGGGGGSAVCGG